MKFRKLTLAAVIVSMGLITAGTQVGGAAEADLSMFSAPSSSQVFESGFREVAKKSELPDSVLPLTPSSFRGCRFGIPDFSNKSQLNEYDSLPRFLSRYKRYEERNTSEKGIFFGVFISLSCKFVVRSRMAEENTVWLLFVCGRNTIFI